MPMSSPKLSFFIVMLGVAVSLAACDSTEVQDSEVFVADFYFEGAQAHAVDGTCQTIEGEEYCLSYSFGEEDARAYTGADNDSQIQEGIREMLDGADNGMVVIAYQAIPEEIDENGFPVNPTYYSMPYVQAVEGSAVIDGEVVPFVDYVTTLNYGYDDADFYLDIETSDGVSATEIEEGDLTEFIDLRLVAIPGDVVYQGSALRADLAELYPTYSDLAKAYDLPERPMPRR